ncbi:DUF2637 domain-containing protein [Streptomyces sp. NPDC048636]|uniref:DUF2637 domain-containing protein n=1 Tax=Streptomyces sp. NPDC048636 TaxID=3155762 RepID=UPI0034416A45
MSRVHRMLIAVVITGAMVIAAIGFAGSYAAVRDLAERKGFGSFAPFFPIGVDAGIVVLLALDLLLTWIRIPFPLLRQTAWLLTAATIAFNGAAAWPDPLGVGMHAVIPVLFVVTVEAARHAVGRVADITADRHMEGVRVSRWLLAFPSTFRLWRRMRLWELRSYDEVIRMEQDRLIYETRLRAQYGRSWRRRAPVEALMPLKLTRYGVPLHQTASSELTAAGQPADSLTLLNGAPRKDYSLQGEDLPGSAALGAPRSPLDADSHTEEETRIARHAHRTVPADAGSLAHPGEAPAGEDPLTREGLTVAGAEESASAPIPIPQKPAAPDSAPEYQQAPDQDPHDRPRTSPTAGQAEETGPSQNEGAPTLVDRYYQAWSDLTDRLGAEPGLQELSDHLWINGMAGRRGGPISPSTLRRYRLGWRIYRVWAEHLEIQGSEPSLIELEVLCAKHGIRSKGHRGDRLSQDDLTVYLAECRRRYDAFAGASRRTTRSWSL